MMKINSTRRKFKFSTRITMKNEWILLRVRDQVSSETSQSRSSRQEKKQKKERKKKTYFYRWRIVVLRLPIYMCL